MTMYTVRHRFAFCFLFYFFITMYSVRHRFPPCCTMYVLFLVWGWWVGV